MADVGRKIAILAKSGCSPRNLKSIKEERGQDSMGEESKQ